jgi:hypothetical protein
VTPTKYCGVAAALLLAGVSVAGESPECSPSVAEVATVPRIAADADGYQGRCVRIDGVMRTHYLYESVDGVYLQPPDSLNPASSGFALGLDNVAKRYSEDYRHVSVVGRVQDCGTVREAVNASVVEDQIVFISGYCHYHDGPYLWVKHLKIRPGAPFERRMGNYDRKDYGDIEPVPADWPHRAMIEELAGKFLTALRAGDRDTLADIHFRNVGLAWKEDEAQLLKFLLKAPKSPFASIRHGNGPPHQIILASRSLLYPEPEHADDAADDYSAIVCFCRTGDCTGRWPIATFDADNLPTRPYACTHIGPYLHDRKKVPHFTTSIKKGGLAEPR